MLHHWCRRQSCKGCTNPHKFWFGENPGKIPYKPSKYRGNLGKISEYLQNSWKSEQTPESMSENGVNGVQNNMKSFFWRSLFMEYQVWNNSGKNLSHPQKVACSYTYMLHYPFILGFFGIDIGNFGVAFVRAHIHFPMLPPYFVRNNSVQQPVKMDKTALNAQLVTTRLKRGLSPPISWQQKIKCVEKVLTANGKNGQLDFAVC